MLTKLGDMRLQILTIGIADFVQSDRSYRNLLCVKIRCHWSKVKFKFIFELFELDIV